MRKHLILSAVAALAVGGTAMADGLSYTYAQGDLQLGQIKAGGNSISGSGLGANGSFGFADNIIATAGLDTNKYSEHGIGIRLTNLSLGVGGHLALTSMIDFVGGASLEHIRASEEGSESDTGWGLTAGFRGAITDKVQWNGGLKYSDVGDFGSTLGLDVGGRYYFMPAFSAGADVTYRKFHDSSLKETVLALNARYDFPGM